MKKERVSNSSNGCTSTSYPIKDNQPKRSILRYCPSNIFIQDFNSPTSFLIIDLKLKKEFNQQNEAK